MSDYMCSMRTNYFHVVDDEAFEAFMDGVCVEGDKLDVTSKIDVDGNLLYSFATHGLITGIFDDVDETDEESWDDGDAYEAFLAGLQELVADDDAIIMIEIGNEKLNDVYAYATIVTTDDTDYIDFKDIASDRATDMLYDAYNFRKLMSGR